MSYKQFEIAQKFRNNGKISAAISLYQKTREIALQAGDIWLASECLHMIGVSHYQEKKYHEAKKYLEESREKFKKQNNKESIGIVLRDLASVAEHLGNLKEAEKMYRKSAKLLINNNGHRGMTKAKLGRLYAKLHNFEKSERYLHAAIADLQKSSEWFFLSTAYLYLAKVYAKKSEEVLNNYAKKGEFRLRRRELATLKE